jgi:hypothetical protein
MNITVVTQCKSMLVFSYKELLVSLVKVEQINVRSLS